MAFAAVAVGALITSCAVGPNFKKPTVPAGATNGYAPTPFSSTSSTTNIAGGEAQHFNTNLDIPFDWWKAFECPELNSLVEKALRANPTIEAARASLRQAQELTYAQQGGYYPTIGGDYNVERQELAGNLGGNSPGVQGNGSVISTYQNPNGQPFNAPVYYTFHTAEVTVGYTVDVFGENRRQVESLEAQAAMQRYELDAAYITLESSVVGAAIQEASTRDQIAATEKIISASSRALDALKHQRKSGYVSDMDVAAQEVTLAQIQQTLPPLQKQLEQIRDLIRALAGNMPGQDVPETFQLSSLHLPQDLPLSVPSAIIKQRPDVRAAEETMRSANAQIGAAIANRLPQFTISGAYGGAASQFGQMFSSGGPFWNITGDVAQTIFAGGTLMHRQRAAKQAMIQSAAQYRSTVLGAFQNVADTLHALVADADALKAASATEQAAKTSFDITTRQYQVGYANYLALLISEQAYTQAVIAVVQARANRYADTAALFQALGGGWWNRADLAKK